MRVSLNTIQQYTNVDLTVDELVAKINQQLGGVEEVIDLGKRYEKIVIVKVIESRPLENSDHLHICLIDDGGVTKDVERNIDGLVQVLTGAPNVHEGMIAVWLPPSSTVPASYDDGEPFTLGSRAMRGAMSHGMLASMKELGIGDSHEGLLAIDVNEWKPGDVEIKPGVSFAKVYGLDDTIIEIENKMFTHRPDLFGQLGVAREIAGIQGSTFTSPAWYLKAPEFGSATGLALDVFNDIPRSVPRFMAVALKNVSVGPSPLWLQIELMRLGSKSINNVVDITNYVMLLTAQPVHAYDYAKLRGKKLGARQARTGEKITLLNHKTYELSDDDIVIADEQGPIGLAGIMGGGESEVSEVTKDIVLEVGTFDMYTIRKTSMRHGLFTDALTRFNKGQSPLQNPNVLGLLVASVQDTAGGEQASEVFDLGDPKQFETIRVSDEFINTRLGLKLQNDEIMHLLRNVEISIDSRDDHGVYFEVSPPFWRTDLELPEDIVEEVGRLYGYDKLPRELPSRTITPTKLNAKRELARKLRAILARAGANEVLTYSFVHERVLRAAGQDISDAYQLSNALSPDLQYYRLSLTPSLLDKIHANSKSGYDEFAVFELGKSHSKTAGLNEEHLPVEIDRLALSYASKDDKTGAAFYRAKNFLEFLARQTGIEFIYEPLDDESTTSVMAPFEPKRSATIRDKATGRYIGIVGEYKKSTKKNFKLPEYTAGFELDTEALQQLLEAVPVKYRPLGRYPSVQRDMSLKTESTLEYATILTKLNDALSKTGLDTTTMPVGIYQPDGKPTKNTTFRITLSSPQKTLTSAEVNEIIDQVGHELKATINAEAV